MKTFYMVANGNPCIFDDEADINDWPDFQETKPEMTVEEVKSIRNNLLGDTDFYALSDVTMSSEMATYRQALRDLPAQEGFPDTITWPTKP